MELHTLNKAQVLIQQLLFLIKHFFAAEWLWVAITRATELDNVYFYDYTFDEEFNRNLIQRHFGEKSKDTHHKIGTPTEK